PVAMFKYASGRPRFGDAMTAAHARAYGSALANLHLRMDNFEATYPRFEIDFELLLSKPLTALEPRMTERPHDLTYLQRIAEDIREAFVEFDDRGLTTGLCHGAVTGRNAHLSQRGEFTFFDFDMA